MTTLAPLPTIDSLTPQQQEAVFFQTVERFLREPSARKVADSISKDFHVQMTREQVYPALRKAVRRNWLHVSLPRERALEEMLGVFPNNGDVHVVNAQGDRAPVNVSELGAEVVLSLIKELGRKRDGEAVHLGLGVGPATMRVARHLGSLLRYDTDVPKLSVHALSTAYSIWDPLETPIAYFAYFKEAFQGSVEFVGLFSEPMVDASRYDTVVTQHPIVRDAFERAHEIDIVVTSLASTTGHQHGFLSQYLEQFDRDSFDALAEEGWLGDIQLRPYSGEGPIPIESGMKPVTLFELSDLVELAATPDKHVVLLCAPCGHCQASKAPGLLPLLSEPSLRLWNHLVVDRGTAREIVKRRVAGD